VKEEQEMKSSSSNRMTQRGAIVALSYMVIAGDSVPVLAVLLAQTFVGFLHSAFFFQVFIVSRESLLL
jgi:hypothetical protein